MSGWTKLFSSIVTSSIWVEDDAILRVWIAMLAMADAEGVVEGSVPGFANLAHVTTEQMRLAVDTLSSPDADSRTPDHEGRRIEAIEGGWRILNYGTYRERGQAKEGSRAPYYRTYRQRKATVAQQDAQQRTVARYTEERGERKEYRGESTEEKKEESSPLAPAPLALRAEDLQALWNDVTDPPIPRCRELTPARRKHAEARLRDQGLDGMREVFTRINALPFCQGENDRGWTANIDWAMKPGNIAKVLEGNYSQQRQATRRATGRTGAPPPDKYDGVMEV